MVARAERCPATVTLRITVGHSVATYRISECISNVPRNVNCWVYPCGPTGAMHDNLLMTLDGREVGLRIGRDSGGLTRYITFEVYESENASPTSIFEGSGDCVVNARGVAIPVRPRGIALGGLVTRL